MYRYDRIGPLAKPLERWLARAQRRGMPLAIVLGASSNGLSWIRSLGRRGVPVILIDGDALAGLYSRYGYNISVPGGADETERLLALLHEIGGRLEQPAAIFSTSDHYCLFLGEHGARLAPQYRFFQPDVATVRAIVDKSAQYRVAGEVGVPLPATFFPRDASELEAIDREIRYPAILKPYRSHLRPAQMREKQVKVMFARSVEELRAAYARAAELGIEVMVQEVIPGGDDALYGYWAFWDGEGRERAYVTKRKLRQAPPLFGDGSCQQTVERPEVAELSRRLLKAFGYRGFVGVEFKRDPRDGSYRLMEINPRTESGNQLAISAGVDFPWIGYRYVTGVGGGALDATADAVLDAHFTPGVTYVHEEWDLKAFLALRRQGTLGVARWLRSWFGAEARALGAWDDPLPLLVTAGYIARAAARRARDVARAGR